MTQVLNDLTAARDLLQEDGWCSGLFKNKQGSHCALGAVYEPLVSWVDGSGAYYPKEVYTIHNDSRVSPVLDALYAAVPEPFRQRTAREFNECYPRGEVPFGDLRTETIAAYNNRTGESSVIEMFNVAIAAQGGKIETPTATKEPVLSV